MVKNQTENPALGLAGWGVAAGGGVLRAIA